MSIITSLDSAIRKAVNLGATIPGEVTTGRADLADLADRLETFRAGLGHDVGAAVLDALEHGHDPVTAEPVTLALRRRDLAGLIPYCVGALDARNRSFVDHAAPAVLASLHEPFDQAAATIVDAVPILGGLDLDDDHGIARRGPDAGKAWAEVRIAEDTIRATLTVWRTLAAAASTVDGWDTRYAMAAIANIPPADFIEHRLERRPASGYDAARHGWPLHLATPDEHRARITAIRSYRPDRPEPATPTPASVS